MAVSKVKARSLTMGYVVLKPYPAVQITRRRDVPNRVVNAARKWLEDLRPGQMVMRYVPNLDQTVEASQAPDAPYFTYRILKGGVVTRSKDDELYVGMVSAEEPEASELRFAAIQEQIAALAPFVQGVGQYPWSFAMPFPGSFKNPSRALSAKLSSEAVRWALLENALGAKPSI